MRTWKRALLPRWLSQNSFQARLRFVGLPSGWSLSSKLYFLWLKSLDFDSVYPTNCRANHRQRAEVLQLYLRYFHLLRLSLHSAALKGPLLSGSDRFRLPLWVWTLKARALIAAVSECLSQVLLSRHRRLLSRVKHVAVAGVVVEPGHVGFVETAFATR